MEAKNGDVQNAPAKAKGGGLSSMLRRKVSKPSSNAGDVAPKMSRIQKAKEALASITSSASSTKEGKESDETPHPASPLTSNQDTDSAIDSANSQDMLVSGGVPAKAESEQDVPSGSSGLSNSSSINGSSAVKHKKSMGNGRARGRQRVNWLINLLYSRGEHPECLRLIETQLKSCDGMCEYALYVKGLIYRSQGKVQEALELFQAATLLNPSNHDNLRQVGRCLFLLGKHKASIDVFDEAALCSKHEDWEIFHNKGVCYMFLKEYDKALEAFQNANSIQRHDITFIEMGKIHTATGDIKQAIEVYIEALEFSPENPELLTTLGLLYLRDGENFKAFEHLGNSLTHDACNAKSILAAGSVIQDHGDMDVALIKYRVAAIKTPNSAQLWNNIGMCFFGRQRYVAAVACLKRSLYLDPFQWITAHNLGLVFMHSGQNASAFHYLSTSINLKPAYAPSYMYLAIVLARLGDAESSIAAYDKALQLDADDPICYLNYAATLHNMGEREHAQEQYEMYERLCARMSSDERRTLVETCGELHANISKIYQKPQNVSS